MTAEKVFVWAFAGT